MKLLISVSAAIALSEPAFCCDLCSIYAASQAQAQSGVGVFAGAAEQFTHFGTVQDEGRETGSQGQYIDSSVAQVFAGYNFNDRVGVELSLPVISRSYGSHVMHGSDWGPGDLTLLGTFVPYQSLARHHTIVWTLLGGVKLPTGDSSRLNTPDSALPEGIGGHDLALGSGSYDGLVGTGLSARWRHWFATANVQYAIRTEGDFQHQYANDLTWFAGPGAYLALTDDYSLSCQFIISGETKGKDTFAGVPDPDSAETLVYVGPQINWTWGSRMSVNAGIDVPVTRNNSGVQVLPDYRVRAAFTWRF
jgi:hypothetical protein